MPFDSAELIRPYNTEVANYAFFANKYVGEGDDVQTNAILPGAVPVSTNSLEDTQSISWSFDTSILHPIFHLPAV